MTIVREEYYQRYDELKALLERAYYNVYSLQEIDNYNQVTQQDGYALPQNAFFVISHICELLKADLGLIVWKIYADGNNKTNTIKHLARDILQSFSDVIDTRNFPKTSLPHDLDKEVDELETLRKQYLAHNDLKKQSTTIAVPKLFAIVEELRKTLNELCFSEIDSRVAVFSDRELLEIKMRVSSGLGLLIRQSLVQYKSDSIDSE